MAAAPPPMDGLLAHPSYPSPSSSTPASNQVFNSKGPDEPIRKHTDLPGDPYMGTDGGGGGKRHWCKNLTVERNPCKKPNISSLIPNITKVTILSAIHCLFKVVSITNLFRVFAPSFVRHLELNTTNC
jgi:hypothetical protein